MPSRPDVARSVEAGADGQLEYMPNPLREFMPKYHVYIYNIGPLSHNVEKGSAGTFRIPACEAGKRYTKALVFPAIVSTSYIDHTSGAMRTDDVEGKHVARDIVNPYLGGDWSEGQNLEDKGVFWTLNDPPTEEELTTARTKMETYGRKVLAVATELETKGQLGSITPTMRLFATYFGEDRPWNRIYKKLGDCPICSEPMKAGTVKHTCGYVVDPEGAYKAGVISETERDDLLARRGLTVKSKK